MESVWADRKEKYEKTLEYAMALTGDELYSIVKKNKMPFYAYPSTTMNLLSCGICSYRLKNNFAGCSMCDYEDKNLMDKIYMTALREKNVKLFTKAIINNFTNTRGERSYPNIFELISSYDVFSDNEFPEELFFEMFVSNKLFLKEPFCYIFETRASSVTIEKLNIIKKYLPKNSRVIIEFGVETSNEWIRNHWLNKNINNEQIFEAIDCIHRFGYKASADVLIGIPGLLELQHIKMFTDTILWLDKIGADQMVVLPLNRKDYTLQGIIYKYLKNDTILLDSGLVQGEHTGVPWLTTIVSAIYNVIALNPNILNKMSIAQVYPHQNTVSNVTPYNKNGCKCNKILTDELGKMQYKRDYTSIRNAFDYAHSNKHNCYKDYCEIIKKQGDIEIVPTLRQIINHLVPHILTLDSKKAQNAFKIELSLYKE